MDSTQLLETVKNILTNAESFGTEHPILKDILSKFITWISNKRSSPKESSQKTTA